MDRSGRGSFQRLEQAQQAAEMRSIFGNGVCGVKEPQHGGAVAKPFVARPRSVSKRFDHGGYADLKAAAIHSPLLRTGRPAPIGHLFAPVSLIIAWMGHPVSPFNPISWLRVEVPGV